MLILCYTFPYHEQNKSTLSLVHTDIHTLQIEFKYEIAHMLYPLPPHSWTYCTVLDTHMPAQFSSHVTQVTLPNNGLLICVPHLHSYGCRLPSFWSIGFTPHLDLLLFLNAGCNNSLASVAHRPPRMINNISTYLISH